MLTLLPAATELMRWTGGGPGFGWWLIFPLAGMVGGTVRAVLPLVTAPPA